MTTFTMARGRRREMAEATRRRAAALFPDAAAFAAGPGPGPGPGPAPSADTTTRQDTTERQNTIGCAGTTVRADTAALATDSQSPGIRRRERWRLALLEKLPAAVQLRCGLELKAVLALGILALVAVVFAVNHFWTGRPESVEVPKATRTERPLVPAPSSGPAPEPAARSTRVVVDVTGKVRDPGVHELPTGSRVADALKAAGGALPGTDTSALNLARVLADGEQVIVGAPPAAAAPSGASAGPGGSGAGAAPVSLNTATAEQLDTLPGVGPVLAQHIIDYRTRHGGFTSVDQLQEVNGIGERRFSDLKPLVRP